MSQVFQNYLDVKKRLTEAAQKASRDPAQIHLVVVSKTVIPEVLQEVVGKDKVILGENRVQELLGKKDQLPNDVEWHLIGHLQSNKIRKILPNVTAIHSVDSLTLARDIDRIAGELSLRPDILFEVNVGEESSKIGFSQETLKQQFAELLALPNLQVKGLMCIPPPSVESGTNRPYFAQLRALRDELEAKHAAELPWLSMGMSDDFEDAIVEGATHVRVGSAIFGARNYP